MSHAVVGWGGSCRGQWIKQGGVGLQGWAVVDHAGVGWVIHGCSGSYRGRVRGHVGVGWVM